LRLRFGGLQGSVTKIAGGALQRDIVGHNRFIAPPGEAGGIAPIGEADGAIKRLRPTRLDSYVTSPSEMRGRDGLPGEIAGGGSVQARRDFGNSGFGTFLVVN
jgi:hypothetical protein